MSSSTSNSSTVGIPTAAASVLNKKPPRKRAAATTGKAAPPSDAVTPVDAAETQSAQPPPNKKRQRKGVVDDAETTNYLVSVLDSIVAAVESNHNATTTTTTANTTTPTAKKKAKKQPAATAAAAAAAAAATTTTTTTTTTTADAGTRCMFHIHKIEPLVHVLEFMHHFGNPPLIFDRDGLCTRGYESRECAYVFETFLHRSCFEEYRADAAGRVVFVHTNVDTLHKTIQQMRRIYNHSMVIEQVDRDILVRDHQATNERRIVGTLQPTADVPGDVCRRIRQLRYQHHILLPAANLFKTMLAIPAEIQHVYLSYYAGSHLLLSWDQPGLRAISSRFPVVANQVVGGGTADAAVAALLTGGSNSNSQTSSSNSSSVNDKVDLENRQLPQYRNCFNRNHLAHIIRAGNAFNAYVQFSFPADRSCQLDGGLHEPPIMIKIKIFQPTNSDAEESYMRMWIAPMERLTMHGGGGGGGGATATSTTSL